MTRTTISIGISILALALATLFGLSYMANQDTTTDLTPLTATTSEPTAADTDESRERITAKHFYEDGQHTLVGEIDMPTPCDLLEYDTVVQESMPEQVRIYFTVRNNAETCAQVITPQRFMVEVQVSENATFTATLRGEPVELNLVPAAPGETPDEFELFIKG